MQMYMRAAGPQWRSRLRMVIAVNRFNDPRRDRAVWKGRLPYGTTDQVERELAEAVGYWQREVDRIAPGVATVLGQVLEPPVWDGDRLVDADVLRHLMMTQPTPYWRRFPYAGVRQAMLASGAALERLRELWRVNDEVWIHSGDSDVVDTTNPAGGNAVSLLARYSQEIRGSAVDGPSSLVRLGGGYAFSPVELQYGPRGAPPTGEPEQLGDAARMTLLLSEADNLQREIMSGGRYPMGYFTEQNTLLNSRYVEQFISAMGQDVASALGMPDMFLGLHVRLWQLGLLSDEHSRFLSDPPARVLTSAHGRKTTIGPEDMREVLRPRTDGAGRITGFEILRPGRTLREFGALASRKDRNMTFRPVQYLRVRLGMGSELGRSALGALFDPASRPQALAQRLGEVRQAPGTAPAERLTAQLRDSGSKVAGSARLGGTFEDLLAGRWAEPADELLAALRDYASRPLPDWYLDEFRRLGEVDPADTELAAALSRLTLPAGPGHEPVPAEPAPAVPAPAAPAPAVVDDLAAILEQFTQLTIGPRPAPGALAPAPGSGPAARSRTERGILAEYPELAGAPELARRVQLANLAARRRFDADSRRQRRRYRDYRGGLAGGPRQLPVASLGDCFFEAVQLMAGDHLAAIGDRFGWEGREPSVAQMRAAIADALADSFEDYRVHLGEPDAADHGFYARRFPDLMALEGDEGAQRELLEDHLAWIEA
ncbi:MAG TPA: hypothetical protein VK586_06830, partial [Streptosporangiaceae bacterium]|nr:hypothetical protein [Streptosporangiaceae bacterium]